MVRGLAELYAIDGNAAYLGDVQRTLDYAWEHARDAQGLFETDFTGADKQSVKWAADAGRHGRDVRTHERRETGSDKITILNLHIATK